MLTLIESDEFFNEILNNFKMGKFYIYLFILRENNDNEKNVLTL